MNIEKMIELFEIEGEKPTGWEEFEKIDHPIKMEFKRPDLCAFVKLNELVGGQYDIVCSAEHDQIWLDVELEELAKAITENDIVFLVACGVFVEDDSLSMFA